MCFGTASHRVAVLGAVPSSHIRQCRSPSAFLKVRSGEGHLLVLAFSIFVGVVGSSWVETWVGGLGDVGSSRLDMVVNTLPGCSSLQIGPKDGWGNSSRYVGP